MDALCIAPTLPSDSAFVITSQLLKITDLTQVDCDCYRRARNKSKLVGRDSQMNSSLTVDSSFEH